MIAKNAKKKGETEPSLAVMQPGPWKWWGASFFLFPAGCRVHLAGPREEWRMEDEEWRMENEIYTSVRLLTTILFFSLIIRSDPGQTPF